MTVNSISGCRSQITTASTVPAPVTNAPGLPSIRYRIGTFTSFRQAMLDSIALPALLATSVTPLTNSVGATDTTINVLDSGDFPADPNFQIKIGNEYLQVIDGTLTSTWKVIRGPGSAAHSTGDIVTLSPPNPFATWQAGTASDYQTIFVELWAYLADILTFYQERIANEAYLGTAALRDSLLKLASVTDYHPRPGAGATGLVAFSAAKGSSLIVPANFRVGSKPAPGQQSIVFQTSAAVTVLGDNSSIPLSLVSPDVPFPQNTIVLQGTKNSLAIDDFVLAVENQGTQNEAAHLLQLSTVDVDNAANTTTISWVQEVGDGSYVEASKQVSLFALRVKAAPFGVNAPAWNTLSPALTNFNNSPNTSFPAAPYQNNWDTSRIGSSANPWFYVPVPDDLNSVLFLDAVYKQLNYTSQNPGWAILLTGGVFQVLHVVDARPAAKVTYALSSKVTRFTFAENMSSNVFPFRDTVVLTGDELLPLQVDLPLPAELSGSDLILQGRRTLSSGQAIVIEGNLFDAAANAGTNTSAAEPCILDGIPVLDQINNVTRVKLKSPLIHTYDRASVSVFGNIVEITQGETVKDEVLGSSDGSAFQAYPLKKKPLTYLPSSDPEGLVAVKSTLTVTVNSVAWNERPNLALSGPDANDFATTLDDTGQTAVVFGDGFNGSRPPSGMNNIHVRYRNGLGSAGNLPAGSIQQLIDSIPGLKKVTNPLPLSGGADADFPAQIRNAAPASVRTFSRAVSAPDYAALALSFPGITKATAAWIVTDPVTNRSVAHPYVQLTLATVDETPIKGTLLASNLRSFLDSHRDPNVPLGFQDFKPVYIELIIEIAIDGHFPLNATLGRVKAALNSGENPDGSFGYFAFQNLGFGQPIFLCAIHAAAQNIAGVTNATIRSLRRTGPGLAEPPSTVPHDIMIDPTEIAVIGTPGMDQGQLAITATGGFIDA